MEDNVLSIVIIATLNVENKPAAEILDLDSLQVSLVSMEASTCGC